MKLPTALLSSALLLFLAAGSAAAEELAPYGTATVSDVKFKPTKLAFDFMQSPDNPKAELQQVIGMLKQFGGNAPAGSEVEVVVIGGIVGAFAKENYETFQPQIDAIADMVKNGSNGKKVKFAFCGNSMSNAGYKPEDMHGFASVVQAGVLELARLNSKGYTVVYVHSVKAKDARYAFRPDLKPAAPKEKSGG